MNSQSELRNPNNALLRRAQRGVEKQNKEIQMMNLNDKKAGKKGMSSMAYKEVSEFNQKKTKLNLYNRRGKR